MSYQEENVAMKKVSEASYYEERLVEVRREETAREEKTKSITPEDMPWETCSQGILKHLINDKMNTRAETIDLCMQLIPEGSRSGKHRHMADEYMFILEGRGYSLHWDVDMELGDAYHWVVPDEPSRWEWEEGDSVYIPPNTVHQHFNLDPDKPARFLSAESRTLKLMGLDDLEQMENAPEYTPK